MDVLFYVLIFIVTFVLTEGAAWAMHKYVMHGWGWFFHEDHHKPKYDGVLEKNDMFFLVFAIPSWLLIMFGVIYHQTFMVIMGSAIAAYGACYVLVHDIIIHQRITWFKHVNNPYVKGLRYAHKIHHKHLGKEDGECFGMLWVPFKYIKKYMK